jgi:DNA-binding CsgD family transcriptional regulator
VPASEAFAKRVVFDVSAEDVELTAQLIAQNAGLGTFHDVPTSLDASSVAAYRRAGLGDFADQPWIRDAYRRLDIEDFAAFRTVEPGGKGVAFVAGQRKARAYDRQTTQRWARVAAHVAAGRRLREAGTGIDAVLTTTGRIDHAEGEATSRGAREALRDAVIRQEHARSPDGRRDVEAATDWTALVSGRWSLVDQFERSGLRYIVARQNEHGLPAPPLLASRERTIAHLAALGKSTALIAYELGIADSTVATHLAGIMKKLRATSRIELIRRLIELSAPSA